jgi:hypothetical protein
MAAADRAQGVKIAVVKADLKRDHKEERLCGEIRQANVGGEIGAAIPETNPDTAEKRERDKSAFQE